MPYSCIYACHIYRKILKTNLKHSDLKSYTIIPEYIGIIEFC